MSWLDEYVLGIVDLYDTNDIYEIYDNLEITIIKLDKNNILLKGNDALYNRNHFNKEVVFIRNNLNINYEKFILAHELAHAIIHVHITTAAYNNTLINIGKLERQANYFAFKLLNINPDHIEHNGFTIEQIASSLNLPLDCCKQLSDKL